MVDEEEAAAKKQAEEEKKLGAEAYKARDFEKAIIHFQKAWDVYPKDITFLTNLAAAARVNVTIDDTYGDFLTGNQIVYNPPGVWKLG